MLFLHTARRCAQKLDKTCSQSLRCTSKYDQRVFYGLYLPDDSVRISECRPVVNHHRYGKHPLCFLQNKPRLFSLTQNRFILILLVALTCILHVPAIIKHVNTKNPQKLLNRPLYGFHIDVPENDLSIGRNTQRTCNGD